MKDRKTFVIFDFDGTIADTLKLAPVLGNELLAKMGHEEVDAAKVERLRGMTMRELVGEFNVPFYKLPGLVIQGRALMKERIDELEPIKGIVPLIHELNEKNIPCGIVTTNSRANVLNFMKRNDLTGQFKFIDGGSGIFGKAKRLKNTLKKNNLTPENTIYVGDEIRDIEAAHKVGLQIISVSWGLNNVARLEKSKPDFLVHDIKTLKKMLTKEIHD